MNYIICIPSYKRSTICNNKTLSMLSKNNIPREKINVYCVEDDYDEYVNTLDKEKYNNLFIGPLGIANQRNFIQSQYPEGQHILYLDDDIDKVDLSISLFDSLENLIIEAFNDCLKLKSYIWSVYPVFNQFYRQLKEHRSIGLKFMIGTFYGIINRPSLISLNPVKDEKEDVERTLKYWINDGIMLRYNKVGIKTKFYNKIGGLGTLKQRKEPAMEQCIFLKSHYPEYGRIFTRKNGITEFVIKNIKQKIHIDRLDRWNENNLNIYSFSLSNSNKQKTLREKLFIELEKTKLPNVANGIKSRGQIIGKNENGCCINFGAGKIKYHPNNEYVTNKKFPELFDLLIQYGNMILPTGYDYSCITVNRNVTSTKHKDINNYGLSCITGIGNYENGNLIIYPNESEERKEFNIKDNIVLFNGNKLYHQTGEFTGTRYCLIYYSQKNKMITKDKIMCGL